MPATVIKVFLASPGDLKTERKLIRDRAHYFNRVWADEYEIFFEVRGWEDLPPVSQRPQARINQHAEDCALFIGVLAERWGSDSGAYSSGFEEEYLSAHRRWKLSSVPEIALLFKTLDATRLDDPGPQLSRVIQFKTSIAEAKELYYTEFAAESDLKDTVDSVFSEYAKKRKRTLSAHSSRTDKASGESASQLHGRGEPTVADPNSIDDVVAAIDQATPAVAGDILDFWSRLRLSIYSTSLASEYQDHAAVHSHDVNLAYRKRKHWDLIETERLTLAREMLREGSQYCPGWYWLSDKDLDEARGRLWYYCLYDTRAKKRAAAILEKDTELPPDPDMTRQALEDRTTAGSICRLIARIGTERELPLLARARAQAVSAGVPDSLFESAEFAVQLRTDPEMPVESLVKYLAAGAEGAIGPLSTRLPGLDEPAVEALLHQLSGAAREKAAQMLQEHQRINRILAERLLSDASPRVRECAARALISAGRPFTRAELNDLFPADKTQPETLLGLLSTDRVDIEQLVSESLRLRTAEDLQSMVDFFDLDGRPAFSALAELHWPIYVGHVAIELESDFDHLLDESDARSIQKHGFRISPMWRKEKDSLLEYVRSGFLQAALHALHLHGHPRGLEWAQKFADTKYSEKTRAAAFGILMKLGHKFDYSALARDFKGLPAEAAIALLPGILQATTWSADMLERFASHEAWSVRDALRSALCQAWRSDYYGVLESLLLSSTENTRQLSASVLSKMLPASKLESFLDRYIELPTYYYDVVTIFDRALYGVAPLAN
jgi:hypothetical protein